jgi:hypothetical protein
MLLYTGQRKSEVRALMWSDLHLDEAKPYALFRESTTKDKDKRAVPLRPEIVEQLKALRPKPDEAHSLSKPVFWFRWPTYDLLRGDLKRAGIERVDALGRSVHFHSFRKTWQTLGVRYGINQRVAQEVSGTPTPISRLRSTRTCRRWRCTRKSRSCRGSKLSPPPQWLPWAKISPPGWSRFRPKPSLRMRTRNQSYQPACAHTHKETHKNPGTPVPPRHSLTFAINSSPRSMSLTTRALVVSCRLSSLHGRGTNWLPGLGSNQRPSD